jgi:DNA polymerase III subunit delta
MSIVKSAAADSFIRWLPRDIRFYLVHGADEGLTHERSRRIAHALLAGDADASELLRLDGELLAGDPGALADEARAVPMFGSGRVIWIEAHGRDLLPALQPLLAQPPQDCAIVVKAGQLRKEAALRQIFEKMPNGVSIECYSDDQDALGDLIDAEMQASGLSLAPAARDALLGLLGADRLTTRGEIEKLTIYAMGRSCIEAGDVEAIVGGAARSGLDNLIDGALLGDLAAVELSAARFFSEGGDPDFLMTRLLARFALLHGLRLEMDQGRSFDVACQTAVVRLPASARRLLAQQADRWTSQSIARQLPVTRAAAARVRGEPRLAQALATRILWTLASRVRAERR